jgi:hypothetical protein
LEGEKERVVVKENESRGRHHLGAGYLFKGMGTSTVDNSTLRLTFDSSNQICILLRIPGLHFATTIAPPPSSNFTISLCHIPNSVYHCSMYQTHN